MRFWFSKQVISGTQLTLSSSWKNKVTLHVATVCRSSEMEKSRIYVLDVGIKPANQIALSSFSRLSGQPAGLVVLGEVQVDESKHRVVLLLPSLPPLHNLGGDAAGPTHSQRSIVVVAMCRQSPPLLLLLLLVAPPPKSAVLGARRASLVLLPTPAVAILDDESELWIVLTCLSRGIRTVFLLSPTLATRHHLLHLLLNASTPGGHGGVGSVPEEIAEVRALLEGGSLAEDHLTH